MGSPFSPNVPPGIVTLVVDPAGVEDTHQVAVEAGTVSFVQVSLTWWSP